MVPLRITMIKLRFRGVKIYFVAGDTQTENQSTPAGEWECQHMAKESACWNFFASSGRNLKTQMHQSDAHTPRGVFWCALKKFTARRGGSENSFCLHSRLGAELTGGIMATRCCCCWMKPSAQAETLRWSREPFHWTGLAPKCVRKRAFIKFN